MKLSKFITKQGQTKDSTPKMFEESIEVEFPGIPVESKVIAMSSIKFELLKCSFEATEPFSFFACKDGKKLKRVGIDYFDMIEIIILDGYELKGKNYEDSEEGFREYSPVEVNQKEGYTVATIFFGDFLKMILHDMYVNMGVSKSFILRLGTIPVVVYKDGNVDSNLKGSIDPYNIYSFHLTTEKGDEYYIHSKI